MLIKVAHSPDPDDAFMFYALKMKKFPMSLRISLEILKLSIEKL